MPTSQVTIAAIKKTNAALKKHLKHHANYVAVEAVKETERELLHSIRFQLMELLSELKKITRCINAK